MQLLNIVLNCQRISHVLQQKGYTPITLLEMLVLAAFTRQSRPSSSTLIVRFSLM